MLSYLCNKCDKNSGFLFFIFAIHANYKLHSDFFGCCFPRKNDLRGRQTPGDDIG